MDEVGVGLLEDGHLHLVGHDLVLPLDVVRILGKFMLGLVVDWVLLILLMMLYVLVLNYWVQYFLWLCTFKLLILTLILIMEVRAWVLKVHVALR